MDDARFADLLARARADDEAAIAELLREFEHDVRLMVRVRLPRALRPQFDSMDFVQAVWQSVLAGPGRAGLDFAGPRHFRGYLAGVVRNKVWQEHRRRGARKYDLGREEPLHLARPDGRPVERAVAADDPTPSEHVQADDRLGQLLAGRSPAEARAIHLRREGRTFEEIAAETGLHERTVRRLIDSLREAMERRRWT